MNTLHPDISDTCTQTDKLLWDAYARGAGNQPGVSGDGRLVFPRYREEEKLRVSEQEARFAFVEALCRGPLRYSVEAPTTKRYSFSSAGSRSASTDLQIHEMNMAGICNVEFKAKGKTRMLRTTIQSVKTSKNYCGSLYGGFGFTSWKGSIIQLSIISCA